MSGRPVPLDVLRAEIAVLTARDATRAGELAALRAEVGGLKVALHLQAHDRDWLQVVAEATRAMSFTAQTLLAQAEEHRRLQQALAGMTARAVGARLSDWRGGRPRASGSPRTGATAAGVSGR